MTEPETEPLLRHLTPIDTTDPTRLEPRPAGNHAHQALKTVTDEFTRYPHVSSSRVANANSADLLDEALLFRVAPGRIHVVGNQSLAAQVRDLLGKEAIPGWRLHPLPDTRSPLHELAGQLSSRYYNLLARSGFTSVEEVAATPEQCLLELRGAGLKFLTAVRDAISDMEIGLTVSHPGPADAVADRQAQLDARLSPAQRIRYREFTAMLARSSMPTTALDTIAQALDSEPVPQVDPTVTMLVETAGEADLRDYYTAAHQDGDQS